MLCADSTAQFEDSLLILERVFSVLHKHLRSTQIAPRGQKSTPCRHSAHRESNGCFQCPTDIHSRGSTATERHFLPFDGKP